MISVRVPLYISIERREYPYCLSVLMEFNYQFLGLAILCSTAASATGRYLQQSSCPIKSSQHPLDFSGVAAACGAGKDPCTTCVCAVYNAFVPAFQAANLTYSPKNPGSFPKAQADNVLRASAPGYVLQATTAGVSINSLMALQQCPGDNKPACLTPVFQKLTPEAKAAAAANPPPEPNTMSRVVGGFQDTVGQVANTGQKVVDAGQKIVASGRDAVDAVGSAARSIGSLFSG